MCCYWALQEQEKVNWDVDWHLFVVGIHCLFRLRPFFCPVYDLSESMTFEDFLIRHTFCRTHQTFLHTFQYNFQHNLCALSNNPLMHPLTQDLICLLTHPPTQHLFSYPYQSNHPSPCTGNDRMFSKLLTKYTLPEELFGPLSLSALERDLYVRNIDGYLPTARLVGCWMG